jgi:hypothetical protein
MFMLGYAKPQPKVILYFTRLPKLLSVAQFEQTSIKMLGYAKPPTSHATTRETRATQ